MKQLIIPVVVILTTFNSNLEAQCYKTVNAPNTVSNTGESPLYLPCSGFEHTTTVGGLKKCQSATTGLSACGSATMQATARTTGREFIAVGAGCEWVDIIPYNTLVSHTIMLANGSLCPSNSPNPGE